MDILLYIFLSVSQNLRYIILLCMILSVLIDLNLLYTTVCSVATVINDPDLNINTSDFYVTVSVTVSNVMCQYYYD